MLGWKIVSKKTYNRLLQKTSSLALENARLKQDLKEAKKNDHRDPKTGKFIKPPSSHNVSP